MRRHALVRSIGSSLFAFDDKRHYSPAMQHGIAIEQEIDRFNTDAGQYVQVFLTKYFGIAIYINGSLQSTQYDNFCYREMLAHVPVWCWINSNIIYNFMRCLVIGGGDGGAVSELLKYSAVKHIDWVDIDKEVINIYRTHMPERSYLHDDRVTLHIADATKWLPNDSYDIVLIDGVDPIDCDSLYQKDFYSLIKDRMSANAVGSSLSGTVWPDSYMYTRLLESMNDADLFSSYYQAIQPSCHPGYIGFRLFSKKQVKTSVPRTWEPDNLGYYSKKIHNAAFDIPKFFDSLYGLVPPQ